MTDAQYMLFAWDLAAAVAIMIAAVSARVLYHLAFGKGVLNIPLGFAVLHAKRE